MCFFFTGWVSASGFSTARIATPPLPRGRTTDGGKVTGWVCNRWAAKWCPGLRGHTGLASSSPNAPPQGGFRDALLSSALLRRQQLGAPRVAGCTQGCRHWLLPVLQQASDTRRKPTRSGSGPLGYFRLVIAGYGFPPSATAWL